MREDEKAAVCTPRGEAGEHELYDIQLQTFEALFLCKLSSLWGFVVAANAS